MGQSDRGNMICSERLKVFGGQVFETFDVNFLGNDMVEIYVGNGIRGRIRINVLSEEVISSGT